jgi:hypothetical protein
LTACNSFLPQLLRVRHLLDDLVGNRLVALEKMQQLLAHVVDQLRANLRVAQLVLRLRFEHGVFQTN